MNPAVANFRQLPVTERLAGLLKVKAIIDEHGDEDLKWFAGGLIGHLASLSQDVFAYIDEQKENIKSLPQSNQGKTFMLGDLGDYCFVDAAIRERIKDRLQKGLVQKPPEPDAKKPKASVMVSGINHEFDEGYEP